MTTLKAFTAGSLSIVAASLLFVSNASAETLVKPKLVPPPGGGPAASLAGQWYVQGWLYNQFKLSLNLDRYGEGNYTARIGRTHETCSGDVNWTRVYGGKIRVSMKASWCDGRSGQWTADTMICEPKNGLTIFLPTGGGYGDKLNCEYWPGGDSWNTYGKSRISLRRS